eukprot:TRINITY_DN42984_c0_g1_i1.p1 TRINITY_DN42984_c0_g1~~TRINITY_DN42984_c0_g1_i1.p1  ORF type:complete len:180 (+),score=8.87 TRINITY_DN42984_c0_g1_i1:46-585(+)
MKKRNTLVEPTVVTVQGMEVEYSVHRLSSALVPEVSPALPEVPIEKFKELLVVPTFQRTRCSVIEFTKEAAEEKDFLLEIFVNFANSLILKIRELGYWADYVDPTSGYTSVRGSSPYCESTAAECLLPYTLQHVGTAAGGCNMISHPRYGLGCYPATIFTLCPLDAFKRIVAETYPPTT